MWGGGCDGREDCGEEEEAVMAGRIVGRRRRL